MAQVVNYLPSKCKAVQTLVPPKKEKEKPNKKLSHDPAIPLLKYLPNRNENISICKKLY
jgi:hypothetical protein